MCFFVQLFNFVISLHFQRMVLGVRIVMQQVTLASSKSTSSSSCCSTCNPASYSCTWESSRSPTYLVPCTLMGDTREATHSWLCPSSALTIEAICNVNQRMGDVCMCVCVSLSITLPNKLNKSRKHHHQQQQKRCGTQPTTTGSCAKLSCFNFF